MAWYDGCFRRSIYEFLLTNYKMSPSQCDSPPHYLALSFFTALIISWYIINRYVFFIRFPPQTRIHTPREQGLPHGVPGAQVGICHMVASQCLRAACSSKWFPYDVAEQVDGLDVLLILILTERQPNPLHSGKSIADRPSRA